MWVDLGYLLRSVADAMTKESHSGHPTAPPLGLSHLVQSLAPAVPGLLASVIK